MDNGVAILLTNGNDIAGPVDPKERPFEGNKSTMGMLRAHAISPDAQGKHTTLKERSHSSFVMPSTTRTAHTPHETTATPLKQQRVGPEVTSPPIDVQFLFHKASTDPEAHLHYSGLSWVNGA